MCGETYGDNSTLYITRRETTFPGISMSHCAKCHRVPVKGCLLNCHNFFNGAAPRRGPLPARRNDLAIWKTGGSFSPGGGVDGCLTIGQITGPRLGGVIAAGSFSRGPLRDSYHLSFDCCADKCRLVGSHGKLQGVGKLSVKRLLHLEGSFN